MLIWVASSLTLAPVVAGVAVRAGLPPECRVRDRRRTVVATSGTSHRGQRRGHVGGGQ